MVNNYKFKKMVLILIILIISALIISAFFIKGNLQLEYDLTQLNKLVNISSLSDEFIDNYLNSVRTIKTEDKENILIVTSTKKISETYGAFNIIEAPNNQYILQYDSKEKKNNALKNLRKNKKIISIEENIMFTPYTTVTDNYNSWGVVELGYDDVINTADVEKLNKVTVAVVDTGVQMSEFNKYYEGKVEEIYDYFNPDNEIEEMTDAKGHGTHVAGTIAESTPSNVKILPVKVAGSDNVMYMSDVVAAINNIAKNKMANVINLSLGSSDFDFFPTSLYNAIAAANSENIICVGAAGNSNISSPHYPSSFDNALAIAAVDSHLEKTFFSNYGDWVDFASPGYKINGITSSPNNPIKSGTSMAAPHASAAVAILKSYNINLTLEQTVTLLKKYAIDIGDNGYDKYYGYGVINFNGAKFCDENVTCDEYNVFANDNTNSLLTIKIEQAKTFVVEYNYGNITNIMQAEINLYYDKDYYYTKTLAQLINDIEIIGYDPFDYSKQQIIIKYKGFQTTLEIDNSNPKAGWEYEEQSDNSINITKINYPSFGLEDATYDFTDYQQIIYVPSEIDGKKVSTLNDNVFYDLFKIKKIYIAEGIKNIGKSVFGREDVKSKTRTGPIEIMIPKSIEYIDSSAFENTKKAILYVYKDSYAEEYAIDNNIDYTYPETVDINLSKKEYKAFEKVKTDDLTITVNYNGSLQSTETITKGYEIKYNNNEDSFRYGDTSFKIIFDTGFGYHVEEEVAVTITKATQEYVVPDNLTGTIGEKLSEIELPSGFTWSDESTILDKKGQLVFYGKYEPTDTTNYEIIDDIEIPVLVQGILITPEFSIKDKTYNGLLDIPSECFVINNLNVEEYSITNYTLSSSDVGENTVNIVLKLSDEKFKTYSLEGDVQEKEYTATIKIIPEKLLKPTFDNRQYIYNGEVQNAIITNFVEEKMNISGNSRTDAGEQDIVISLKSNNYVWDDNTTEDMIFKFRIEKAVPKIPYTSSDNMVVYDNQKHGINLNISNPDNVVVSYMDKNGEYTLQEMPMYSEIGEYVIKYKIHISDNYTDIFGEQKVNIIKATIVNNSSGYEGYYDENEHSININVNVTEYTIKYSINNTDYDLNEIPKFKDVGEYTVNYKITKENYNDLTGSTKVKIYGIKSFDSSIVVKKNNNLIVRDNMFSNITKKINTFALSTQYMHYDKDNKLLEDDIIKTGDILKINLNNAKDYIFNISVYGDVSADGKVTSADYVKIRKHIMNAETINDNIYIYAADVNNDNRISSADYVKIRKHIMNGGGL